MIEQCKNCKHKEILNGGIVGCLYMDADCRKGEMFDPITNADRIRAMSDEELARFAADRQANETYMRLTADRYTPSEALLKATREILYCKYLYWLRQPVKDGEDDG